jgi:dipeptidyl aminopeptidase/acylaminoacyl peptidase
MKANGQGPHQTSDVPTQSPVSWGPGDRRIALADLEDGGIVTVRADGTDGRPLTYDYSDADPSWSPDGRMIVFSRIGKGLFVVRPDGSGLHRLIATSEGAGERLYDLHYPAWSPNGTKIAFVRQGLLAEGKPSSSSIEVVGADGRHRTTVARFQQSDYADRVAWSPDGRSILYVDGPRLAGIWIKPRERGNSHRLIAGRSLGMPYWGVAPNSR